MIDNFKSGSKKPPKLPSPRLRPKLSLPSEDEPAFVEPDIIAEAGVSEPIAITDGSDKTSASKNPFHKLVAFLQSRSKKQKIIIAIVAAVVVLGGGTGLVFALKHKPKAAPVVKKEEKKPEPPKPTTEASTLTGLQVPIGQNKQPVTGVMIENSPDARPQSGLKDAGVVFEAIAEGGITRFLALFQDSPTVPDHIGPVRSVRPYYLDYVGGFDAGIAHVGGSAEALEQVRNGMKDLDQFFNPGPYRRISERYAPHNMYTSIAGLIDLQKQKGYTTSNYTGFLRKGKEAPAATPTAKTIDLTISGFLYNVHYDYDAATNTYKRSEGGKPHVDERSNAQLSPKVVAVLVVPQGINADGIHTTYESIGSGKLFLFQDGTVTEGIWEKTDRKTQLRFGDANGAPLTINAGQTWVTLIGTAGSASYAP